MNGRGSKGACVNVMSCRASCGRLDNERREERRSRASCFDVVWLKRKWGGVGSLDSMSDFATLYRRLRVRQGDGNKGQSETWSFRDTCATGEVNAERGSSPKTHMSAMWAWPSADRRSIIFE